MMLAPVVGGVPRRIDADEVEERVATDVADLVNAGVDAELQIVTSTYSGGPAHDINDVAEQVDAGLIVVGTSRLRRDQGDARGERRAPAPVRREVPGADRAVPAPRGRRSSLNSLGDAAPRDRLEEAEDRGDRVA